MNVFKKLSNFWKKIKTEYAEEVKKIEKENESFENDLENLNDKIKNVTKKFNEKDPTNLISTYSAKFLDNIETKENLYKKFKIEEEIDPEKFTIFYADDHPGALFQMFNDLRVVIEKNLHLIDIDESLNEDIKNLKITYNFFNIISFGTQYAPCKIKYYLEHGIIPDIAVLDVVFGGLIIDEEKINSRDGIDVAEEILEKNPKALILFYTGCDLTDNSKEYIKLQKLIKDFPDNILIADKDINDQPRIEAIYKILTKLFQIFPDKYQKLLKRNYHEKCQG